MTTPAEPSRRSEGWRMVALGMVLILAGVAGVALAWFPAPPHSTAAPMSGWAARWFAAGVGWFGVVVAAAGIVELRDRGGARKSLRRAARAAFSLALACWLAWAICLWPF